MKLRQGVKRVRNIGIMAHIDAGKTTLTERMLYYAGESRRIGEVHHGDTVMDYLEQERERGITINSASTTFSFNGAIFNLIDTPGHVDFTYEVERSIRVLDGAVALFDAVAGVQAQSETVWKQARRYGVPRIAFVNKLDREGANMNKCVKMIEDRFNVDALVTQLPFIQPSKGFNGVIDLISQNLLIWDQNDKETRDFESNSVRKYFSNDEEQISMIIAAREELGERIAAKDEEFLEDSLPAVESDDGWEAVEPELFKKAIRRLCLNQEESRQVPVLCGSALKNTGVQPLMNAVIDYLPHPFEMKHGTSASTKWMTGENTAFVFKVQHDPNRGPLSFVRVYSGEFSNKKTYENVTLRSEGSKRSRPSFKGSRKQKRAAEPAVKERVQGVLRAYANEYDAVDSILEGDIGVLCGLKAARTGDTLTSHASREPLAGIKVPEPVFSAAIEAESLSDEPKLEEALRILVRDDPSLSVVSDGETGQLVIHGMGELHLDISVTKLQRDFNVPCELGKVCVAYRETLLGEARTSGSFFPRGEIGCDGAPLNSSQVKVTLDVRSHPGGVNVENRIAPRKTDDKRIRFLHASDDGEVVLVLKAAEEKALREGILEAFTTGPLCGYKMQGVEIDIVENECFGFPGMDLNVIRGAASRAALNLFKENRANPKLLEPVARVEISVPNEHVGPVLADLSSTRRGQVLNVESEIDQQGESSHGDYAARAIISATVPLEGMIGYSTPLRTITSGEGTFSLHLSGYVEMHKSKAH